MFAPPAVKEMETMQINSKTTLKCNQESEAIVLWDVCVDLLLLSNQSVSWHLELSSMNLNFKFRWWEVKNKLMSTLHFLHSNTFRKETVSTICLILIEIFMNLFVIKK